MNTDRNLLFGVLAFQDDFIDMAQLAAVCRAWAADKSRPIPELLVERGWLTDSDRGELDRKVERKLRRYGGDVHATLGAVADAAARDAIRDVDDSDIRQSISSLPPAAGHVLVETMLPTTLLPVAEHRSRYTLTRLHGQGGLGKVWIARDQDLNREVALKELQPTQAQHPDAWRRFLKEAQVTGQLEHPNIVPVYELTRRKEDNQPFYTMKFVRGETLSDAICAYHEHRRAGTADRLELPRLLQSFIAVCNAIAYAHSRGVIHRDLKPENVVLGGFGEVIVLDWGLAKVSGLTDPASQSLGISDDAQSNATIAGARIGTPGYMSPEQAQGRIDLVDARSDIYGLGAILFAILTGRAPHRGNDITELLDRIVSGKTPRTRSALSSIPRALDTICAKAMAKSPAARYVTAPALSDDIERWLADEPVLAHRESVASRVRRSLRKNPILVAMIMVFAVFDFWFVTPWVRILLGVYKNIATPEWLSEFADFGPRVMALSAQVGMLIGTMAGRGLRGIYKNHKLFANYSGPIQGLKCGLFVGVYLAVAVVLSILLMPPPQTLEDELTALEYSIPLPTWMRESLGNWARYYWGWALLAPVLGSAFAFYQVTSRKQQSTMPFLFRFVVTASGGLSGGLCVLLLRFVLIGSGL